MILEGGRRVGKTSLLREFGRTAYAEAIYINFETELRWTKLLNIANDPRSVIQWLEIYAGHKFDPARTLIIFDEVQAAPKAISSLKYFAEDAPQYHIVCAASQTGIALKPGTSYPVGKVSTLRLHPISFKEFLSATGRETLAEELACPDFCLTDSVKSLYLDALRQYFFVGGMPQAVQCFADERDFHKVREIQNEICATIESDFSKYAPNRLVPKLQAIWHCIASLLKKENKKFVYSAMRDAARSTDFETALMWLTDSRLTHRIGRIEAPETPIIPSELLKAFKLFPTDIGLLACLCKVPPEILLDGERIFTIFEGALTHQYVCQTLASLDDMQLYYYANSRGTSAVDFVVRTDSEFIPLEVNLQLNLRSKTLKTYREIVFSRGVGKSFYGGFQSRRRPHQSSALRR